MNLLTAAMLDLENREGHNLTFLEDPRPFGLLAAYYIGTPDFTDRVIRFNLVSTSLVDIEGYPNDYKQSVIKLGSIPITSLFQLTTELWGFLEDCGFAFIEEPGQAPKCHTCPRQFTCLASSGVSDLDSQA
jgi:hypothetical protein